MKANYYLATLALVAGGMAVGIYLVPRGGELATMYYRSGRLDEARRILESEMRDGELSATNVHYATETYLRLGDVDRAIELIDRYSRANDQDVTALRILTRLYRDAGRVALYRQSLERLERIAPAIEQRVELARVYRAAGLYDEWFAMLERLVQQNVAPVEDYMTVAMLKAAKGDREGALHGRGERRRKMPDHVNNVVDIKKRGEKRPDRRQDQPAGDPPQPGRSRGCRIVRRRCHPASA